MSSVFLFPCPVQKGLIYASEYQFLGEAGIINRKAQPSQSSFLRVPRMKNTAGTAIVTSTATMDSFSQPELILDCTAEAVLHPNSCAGIALATFRQKE
jgi:hypothetical protein